MNIHEDLLEAQTHADILREEIIPASGLAELRSHDRPTAVIVASQPGAGTGQLIWMAEKELQKDVLIVDPDELHRYHPRLETLRTLYPYEWFARTHRDAVLWALELTMEAASERKNLIIDTALYDSVELLETVRTLQRHGYAVDVRAVAAHPMESTFANDRRFTESFDRRGFGRHVPKEWHDRACDDLPKVLDRLHGGLGNGASAPPDHTPATTPAPTGAPKAASDARNTTRYFFIALLLILGIFAAYAFIGIRSSI